MSEVHVFYTTSIGSSGTLGALFQPEEAMVRTNCSVPPRTAIGLFRAPLDGEKYARLVGQIRALPTLSGPPATHAPGTPMLSVGLTEDGKTTLAKSTPAKQIPDEMLPVVVTIKKLVEHALDYPEHALGATAEWSDTTVSPGEDICLVLTLKNVGLETVLIANPAAGESPGSVGVQIVLIWDGPERAAEKVNNLVLGPGEVIQTINQKTVKDPEPVLIIPSGEKTDFILRKTARIVPGSYRARLAVTCTDPEGAGKPGLTGLINIELPDFKIVR